MTSPIKECIQDLWGSIGAPRCKFPGGHNEIVGLLGVMAPGNRPCKDYYRLSSPDSGGEIYGKARKVDHLSVPMARDMGIEVVYQERALADQQTLWRNIFLGGNSPIIGACST